LSHVYGLALPLLKRGIPVTPVQLENVTLPRYLDNFRVLLLTYQGMKPLDAGVHAQLTDWVKRGGVLVMCDNDSDPYNRVTEWWNSNGLHYATPREHLFEQLGANKSKAAAQTEWRCGKGHVLWLRENPAKLAASVEGDAKLVAAIKQAATWAKLKWRETNYLLLQRGPYVIAAGLDESIAGEPKTLRGRFINLFDPELRVQESIRIAPGDRYLLRDLNASLSREPQVLASACKALVTGREGKSLSLAVEGVAQTPAVILLRTQKPPRSIVLDGKPMESFEYSAADGLLWIRFVNESRPRTLSVSF
jgi:hypothetical protein